MIIWTGLGFLVAVIVFGSSLLFNLAFDALWGEGYYVEHQWAFGLSLFLSAIACWFIGTALSNRDSRIVVDRETGGEIDLNRNQHALFFIPMRFWGPIIMVVGIGVIAFDLLK